jgi:membrane associated rhomboid family serine protease
MGIYDREYYRREGPSFLGSFTERGKVCNWLVAINAVAFVIQLVTLERGEDGVVTGVGWFTHALWLDTSAVSEGQVWRLLTYAFLHDPEGVLHIIFNMLLLWGFGRDVEDLYGPREFLAVYLLAALLGGLSFQLTWLAGMTQGQHCLGASGAVTTVLVLCAIHYPTRSIYLLFFPFFPIPIWLFVAFNIAQDLFVFLSNHPSRTAVSVHLAGAAFAVAYYKRHWRLTSVWSRLRSSQQQWGRPRLRVYREEPRQPVSVVSANTPEGDEQLEAKLDAVLEKVARYGQSSLSESERQILLRASEIYKRRRS